MQHEDTVHDQYGSRGAIAAPVCADGALSLSVRAPDAGAVVHARHHGERVRSDRQADLAGRDPVLGQAVRDQLRAGRGDGPDHGVRVWHQLGLLLALCRRYFRGAAGDRGADGLFPRGDLCRHDGVRLGSHVEARALVHHADGGGGHQLLGAVDPDRQWLDAASGRRGVQPADHADGGQRLCRGAVQPGGAGQVRSHRVGGLCDGQPVRGGDFLVLSAEGAACRTGAAQLHGGGGVRAGGVAVGGRARGRERLHAGRQPEDEAGRDRGRISHRAGARWHHRLRLPAV